MKRVLRSCALCKRLGARPVEQQMAPLPTCRITPGGHVFDYTGVDYCGPMLVKVGHSLVKRWDCLLTCMKFRAVHTELAESLSMDSFIMAPMRFSNRRRGIPKELYRDNGSNFVGADIELKKALQEMSQGKIANHLLIKRIQGTSSHPHAVIEVEFVKD